MRTAVASRLVISGMWLSACGNPSREADVDMDKPGRVNIVQYEEADCSPGRACTCGNGTVEPNEQCDPAASGWSDFCDDTCTRTVYEPCELSRQCFGKDSLCASYEPAEGRMFCADFCKQDEDCVQLPGFRSSCNFAWCVVLCADGVCPNGMTCVPEQSLRDEKAEIKASNIGVCTAT